MRLRDLAFAAVVAAVPACAIAADAVPLAPHRALYRLTMDTSRPGSGNGDVTAATGTMAYEITDACDAWASRQRLAMTITNRDGQEIEMVSDYVTLESKDGLSMRFRMRQTTDTAVTEQVEGTAKLESVGGAGTIEYTGPEPKTMKMPAGTLFPMMHTAAIIAAAEQGKKFLAVPLFDGTGDKGAQDSSVAIAGWGPLSGAPYPALQGLPGGRVRIAFFDRDKAPGKDKVPGSPDYEVGMKYYANGVADDLQMDFAEFVMLGKLREFVVPEPHC